MKDKFKVLAWGDGEIRGQFSNDQILTDETSKRFEEGLEIARTLPNGQTEKFEIRKAHFQTGHGSISSYWKLTVAKLRSDGRPVELPQASGAPTVHISNSSNFQVGNQNVMTIQASLVELFDRAAVNASTPELKKDLVSRFSNFLGHPAIAAVIGGVSSELARRLSGQ